MIKLLLISISLVFGFSKNPVVKPNFSQKKIDYVLTQTKGCAFFAHDSNSVESGYVTEGLRERIFSSSTDLLKECEYIKKNLGSSRCDFIDIAGHADNLSIGVSKYDKPDGVYFGAHYENGEFETYPPTTSRIFNNLVSCFQSITAKKSLIVFSTCGADSKELPNGEYEYFYYPGKKEATDRLAVLMNRSVVSAIGPSQADGKSTYSPDGWYLANP